MNKKNVIYFLFLCLLFLSTKIICVVTTSTSGQVTAKTYDRTTGTLFLGQDEGAGANAVLKVYRFNGGDTIRNTGIALESTDVIFNKEASINNQSIEFLTLSTRRYNTDPNLAIVTRNGDNPKEQTTVILMSNDGLYIEELVNCDSEGNDKGLFDANGDQDKDGQETAGIVDIAANQQYIFAAVRPNGGDFGDNDSGIAVVKIENPCRCMLRKRFILTQTAAQNENGTDTGIKAKNVDQTTEELYINEQPSSIGDNAVLHWDEPLQRLYIGLKEITSSDSANAGVRSVIVARTNENDSLSFSAIAPDGAFTSGETDEIVGVLAESEKIGVHHLGVMHTSTQRDYLIVNGGNAEGDTVPGNVVYALPLYNDPSDPDLHGTLAIPLSTSHDQAVVVGQYPLPLETDKVISDMVVLGDAVYVSTEEAQDENNDPGIFYSQAMFDEDGIIFAWTPWTKRAFPYEAEITNNGNEPFDTKIKFFDVDAYNGRIWAIDSSSSELAVTNWRNAVNCRYCPNECAGETFPALDLVERLNLDFCRGCFSVLDLDQSTRGLARLAKGRYTLFGGVNQVAFARISESTRDDCPYDINLDTEGAATQNVFPVPACETSPNFMLPENYLLTKLPKNSGCVTSLEYSRRIDDTSPSYFNPNYFFAGTQKGLFIFSYQNDKGFDLEAGVNLLNEAPFVGRTWKQIPQIKGSVVAMKSSGMALYVLTFQSSRFKPLQSTVYNIQFSGDDPIADNISTIAKSSTTAPGSDLSGVKVITGLEILTDDNTDKEQLVLTTNNGLYISTVGIEDVNNQGDAKWRPINPNDTAMYSGIFAVDNLPFVLPHFDPSLNSCSEEGKIQTTIWPVQVADEKNCQTFEKSKIKQLNGNLFKEEEEEEELQLPAFNPRDFNATGIINDCVQKRFEVFDPIDYFWTDGGRRIFIMRKPSSMCERTKNNLLAIPFDVGQWCIPSPRNQEICAEAMCDITQYYWVRHIGASGLLMAGTDTGVISLE